MILLIDNYDSFSYNLYQQFSDGGHSIDDFFIHVYCRNGWQCVYELITHDKSYEEAKEFMANVRAFNYAGWQAVIGMKF